MDDYRILGDVEHLLLRPHVHLGDLVLTEKAIPIYHQASNTITTEPTINSVGLEQIIRELLGNCGDAFDRMKSQGQKGGKLEVDIQPHVIRVRNVGSGISITEYQPNIYWPEVFFTMFRSSSNFDDTKQRRGIGQNGLGVKLVVAFSKRFTLKCTDKVNKVAFEQSYYDNLSRRSPAVISPYTGDSSVEIELELDFARFGLTELPASTICLYHRYAIELALTYKVPLLLNGVLMPEITIEPFARMFFPVEPIMTYCTDLDDINLALVDTPNNGIVMSYVAGIHTQRGGAHVKAVYAELLRLLVDSNLIEEIANRVNKGKKSKDDQGPQVKEEDLMKHVSLFITCCPDKPTFTTQIKDKYKGPAITISFNNKVLAIVKQWKLIELLEVIMHFQELMKRKVTDGTKARKVLLKNLEDANLAGTDRSEEAILLITEGDSAKKYADTLIDLFPDGNDIFGTLKIRGKILNVSKASTSDLIKNIEVNEIKQALGLREDTDYTIPENFKTLRYGRLLFAVDQDHDGTHIKGLLMRLFMLYESLFHIGFIYSWETPIVRLTGPGIAPLRFYRMNEYEAYLANNDTSKLTPKYYKGLATSNDSDVADDKNAFRVIQHLIDPTAHEYMSMIFDTEHADARKDWILNWRVSERKTPTQHQTLSDFINDDFIHFARYSLDRAIPALDSLKRVQRKILYTAIKLNHKDFTKISIFGADVSKTTAYHHGEKSIEEASIRMALDHVNTNNLPYFQRSGQMGNRKNNKLSAGRYVMSKLSWWIPLVFKKEDNDILEYEVDDNEPIEPKIYYPIIPMFAINPIRGISCGWACSMPSYHPIKVAEYIKTCLTSQSTDATLTPWYRGYTGEIIVNDTGFTSYGKFVFEGKNVVVTELPLFVTYESYVEDVIKDLFKKKLIRDYKCNQKNNAPRFTLMGLRFEPSVQTLKLSQHYSININLLGPDGIPRHYDSIEEAIKSYADVRIEAYNRRKVVMLEKLKQALVEKQEKVRFIQLVWDDKITLKTKDDNVLQAQLKQYNVSSDFMKLPMSSMTEKGMDRLKKDITKTEQTLTEYKNKTSVDFWVQELNEFIAEYWKHYKE